MHLVGGAHRKKHPGFNGCPRPDRKRAPPRNRRPPPPARLPSSTPWLLLVVALVLLYIYYAHSDGRRSEITYGMFHEQLEKANIAKVDVQGSRVTGEFVNPPLDPEGKQDGAGNDAETGEEICHHPASLPAGKP